MVDSSDRDLLGLHPPAAEASTFSYYNISWHQQQLSDMSAAGIDVALPVYWGDPGNVAKWSQPGLRVMVTAEQEMISAGQHPPKIGMFYDTSSIQLTNNNVPVDLTTSAGMDMFYKNISDFFTIVPPNLWAEIDGRPILVFYVSQYASNYSQAVFDFVTSQFSAQFGTTPYIIREISWQGITSDAAYKWGAALDHPYFDGDVANVGPGFNETSLYKEGQRTTDRIRDRDCGLFYQDGWDEVQSSNARLVFIETWDEFLEATGVADSLEYSRQYIDATAVRIARWKAMPPYKVPATLQVNFGRDLYTSGLRPLMTNGGDGAWHTTFINGREAAYGDRVSTPLFDNPPGYFFYLNVDSSFQPAIGPVWVTVEYLDAGNVPWALDYDGANDPYTSTPQVEMFNTGTWKLHTFYLPDARFSERENDGADLRINDYNTSGEIHYFSRVWISKSEPSTSAVELTALPDVTLASASARVLSPAGADGDPVTLTLLRGPSFATLETASGNTSLHIAPMPWDVQSCPSVVTVLANSPGSTLPDAQSFRVLVSGHAESTVSNGLLSARPRR